MKRFLMSPDNMARIMPWMIACIMIVSGIVPVLAGSAKQHAIFFSPLLGVVIMIVLLVFTYLYKPLALTADEKGITIDRKVKPVTIDFNDIRSVTQLMPGEMGRPIRTFGNGGLFGYTGYYYSSSFGAMRFYCTRRENYVLIEKQNGKKIVVTPDDPTGFVQELYTRMPALRIAA